MAAATPPISQGDPGRHGAAEPARQRPAELARPGADDGQSRDDPAAHRPGAAELHPCRDGGVDGHRAPAIGAIRASYVLRACSGRSGSAPGRARALRVPDGADRPPGTVRRLLSLVDAQSRWAGQAPRVSTPPTTVARQGGWESRAAYG
ncbi:hypothetical protein [Nonomuraea diastatica]|uniref:Uncharacterized protein n=1 Tax=Nonomuraea diastatica TaxID=1848329 RepID=A0A4R4WEL6_9ACTN|nr:hypothetical protein [Nonomuraea diastatica]TDD17302.1 hypothetical protein E1294_28245 [Nonomuraea diastatica]